MKRIVLTEINAIPAVEPLPWQEQDAINVLKLCNPNLRPGKGVIAGVVQSKAVAAGLDIHKVIEGINSLERKGVLKVDDYTVELTEDGFQKYW